MAPEVLMNKPYTYKVDVFSYGIVLWEIAARQPPYQNMNGPMVVYKVINNNERPNLGLLPADCPPQVIINCFSY